MISPRGRPVLASQMAAALVRTALETPSACSFWIVQNSMEDKTDHRPRRGCCERTGDRLSRRSFLWTQMPCGFPQWPEEIRKALRADLYSREFGKQMLKFAKRGLSDLGIPIGAFDGFRSSSKNYDHPGLEYALGRAIACYFD